MRIAALLGAALAAATLLRLPAAWESGNALNHVSGAWMALADDLARGTFYRPLYDPALGYGGTRYFPLAFALHAALARAGAPLLAAGLALSLAAGLLAALGAARFLRRAGHPPRAALALAPLVLAGFAGQHALAAVRGDLLATALALWGLAALLPPRGAAPGDEPEGKQGAGPFPLTGAVALFTLAFAAKPTALAAAGAGVAFLLLRGERRRALGLAAGLFAGCAAVVLATELLSGGRFLAMLGALGSGGAGPRALLHSPARLATLLAREDPAGLAVLGAAAAALTWRDRPLHPSPPGAQALAALWLAAAGAAALVILASPGTGVNHLVDVEAAAGLLAATCARGAASRARRAAAPAVALAGLATALLLWQRDLGPGRLAALGRAAAAARGGPAPVLSEDPLLPLSAGERPYAADTWMLRLAAARDPALSAPLLAGLRGGAFRAVVLLHAAEAPDAEEWFGRDLGTAALAEIRGRWRLRLVAGPYHVYEFRPVNEPGPQPEGHGDPRPARARSGAGALTGSAGTTEAETTVE